MTANTIKNAIENGATLVIEYVNGNGYSATLYSNYMMNVNFNEAYKAMQMSEAPKTESENKTVVTYSRMRTAF